MEVDEKNDISPNSLPSNPLDVSDSVTATHRPSTPKSTSSRVRLYPVGSSGPFVVYFRPKAGTNSKSLNIIQISKDLTSRFKTITEISKIRFNKLRVIVNDVEQANNIVSSEFFTREYHVYIPARDVEIDGVITDSSLSVECIILNGFGCFKNTSIPSVKILDCKQLSSVSFVEGKKIYSPSNSFRVTFAGSALPSHVSIQNVRIPVRLFIPRVMNCINCKQLGHTAAYCSNKARCGKCGENHSDDSCSKCTEICFYCKGSFHELTTCSMYKQRWEKVKRSLKERSMRSYAKILEQSTNDSFISPNSFNLLLTDVSDSDDPLEGPSFTNVGESRKRKHRSSPKVPSKGPKLSRNANFIGSKPKTTVLNSQNTPPDIGNLNSLHEFPALSGTSKKPSIPQFNQTNSGLLNFSDIMNWIFETFCIPDPLKHFITSLFPLITSFLKQLTVQWPLIASFICFDG